MATNDFPLLTDPHAPLLSHAPTRHRGTEHFNGEDYTASYADCVKSGSEAHTKPSSERRHTEKLKPNGIITESNTNHSNSAVVEYRSDYRKDREEWSDTAISCLLEAYKEKYKELNKGNLRGRDWDDVAEAVSERGGDGGYNGNFSKKSMEQCKNKIDNLKKRYKVELQKINSNWHWFKEMEVIMGNCCDSRINSGESSEFVARPLKR